MIRRVVLALMALALAAAPAAAAAVVALQDDALINAPTPELLAERLDALAATGARVTRVDVLWSQVARSRPQDPRDPADAAYEWGRYDAILRGLAERGIEAIVDYYPTPRWASRARRPRPSDAPRAADAAAFAGALARRYSGSWPDPPRTPLP